AAFCLNFLRNRGDSLFPGAADSITMNGVGRTDSSGCRSRAMEDMGMKVRYLIVDGNGRLHLAKRALVEALWEGVIPASMLGSAAASELRLVSVLSDKDLLPRKIFLLRLPLTAGEFRKENYLTLRIFSRSDCVTPKEVVKHHTEGWPKDFFSQLAVALDVT